MEAERWRNMTASIANGRSKYACVGTNPLSESYARGGGWSADAEAIPLSESSASRGAGALSREPERRKYVSSVPTTPKREDIHEPGGSGCSFSSSSDLSDIIQR